MNELNQAAPGAELSLADYTTPALILPQLQGVDAPSVIQELCQALHREGWAPDSLQFYHAVLNREFLASTVMERGLAFPHARLAGLTELKFAFGRTQRPVLWSSPSGSPVSLIFLLAIPATDAVQYLSLISGLAQLGGQPQLVNQLEAATAIPDILEILRRIRVRPPGMAAEATTR